MPESSPALRHRPSEDLQALLTGTIFVALGVLMFKQVGLLTGGTAGVGFEHLHPAATAVIGGLLMGTGMLILFRHKASLGGFNVLVLYLQEKYGWRAGRYMAH